VRRTETQIIVSLGLCDTRGSGQMWCERFESSRTGLDTLQRSMAAKVSQMLHIELLADAGNLDPPVNPDARDLAMRAWSLWYHASPGVSRESRRMLEAAVRMDPSCAMAWATLAQSHTMDLATRNTGDWEGSIAACESAAVRALELDPNHGSANFALATARAYQGRLEDALASIERQMAANPNLAIAHQWRGIVLILMGRPAQAVVPLEKAIELSPRDRRLSTLVRNLALAYLHMGQDAEGLVLAERSVLIPPPWPRSYETLAAAYAVNGLMEDARAAVAVLLQKWPGYSITQHKAEMMSNRPAFLAQRERLLEGLREAGLPEK
jgi:Tfp pilus assembly protein PilF